jgi:hypothetical protein
MKLQSLVVAAVLALPVVSFAQSNQPNHPLTRAEVRAQLVELEKAGYVPGGDATQYPSNIQAAQARVDAQHDNAANAYGSPAGASSESGARVQPQHVVGLDDSPYAHP